MRRGDRGGADADGRELRRMWVGLLRERWSSLAVIRVGDDTPTEALTEALADVARLLDPGRVRVVDATALPAAACARVASEIVEAAVGGARTVVTVGSPVEDPSRLPLLAALDAAVLVVRLGTAEAAAVRAAVELVGREKTLGCVALHPGAAGRPAPAPERAGAPAVAGEGTT
jgi:hypothetical protein